MVMGFGIIILAMIAVNGYTLFELHSLSATVNNILTGDVQSIDAAKRLQTILVEEERHAQKYLVTRDTTYVNLFTETAKHFGEQLTALHALLTTPEQHRIIRRVEQAHTSAGKAILDAGAHPEDLNHAELAISDTMDVLDGELETLIGFNKNAISSSMSRLNAATSRSLRVVLFLTIGALLGMIAVAFFITRTIVRPIRSLRVGTENVARGVFAPIHVHSRDEMAMLAKAFNTMSEKLKQINDLKADMLQQISHELRVPLQSMYSAYYLLTRQTSGPVTEAQQKLLETIRKNVDRIADFSNQFLDISKIEAGMMKFNLTETDLGLLVDSAVENARVAGAEKNITVDVETMPSPQVRVDPERVTQVINNFLSNAIKYTAAGGNVAVNVRPCPLGAQLAVSDTGVGIDPEDIPKLFTKFYQARNANKGGSRGTGLGLALVKALVEEQGGKVYVTSKVGEGSTFFAEFPASTPPTSAGDTSRKKTGDTIVQGDL
jgi:two-component system sensor histidine kinase GlrK